MSKFQPVPAEGCLTCEDVAHLLDAGEVRENIAARMGLHDDSILRHLRTHGRLDLRARYLTRRLQEVA